VGGVGASAAGSGNARSAVAGTRRVLVLAEPHGPGSTDRLATALQDLGVEYGLEIGSGVVGTIGGSPAGDDRDDDQVHDDDRVQVDLHRHPRFPVHALQISGSDPDAVWLVADGLRARIPTVDDDELYYAARDGFVHEPVTLVRLALAAEPQAGARVVDVVGAALRGASEEVRRAAVEAGRILGMARAEVVHAELAAERRAADARVPPGCSVTARLRAADPVRYRELTAERATDVSWKCLVVRSTTGEVLACRKTRRRRTAWVLPLIASAEFEDDEDTQRLTDNTQEFPELTVFDLRAFRSVGGSAATIAVGDQDLAVVMAEDHVEVFVHTAPVDLRLDPDTFRWLAWADVAARPTAFLRDTSNHPLPAVVPDVLRLVERAVAGR
jgi:hypothetical protein